MYVSNMLYVNNVGWYILHRFRLLSMYACTFHNKIENVGVDD